MIAPPMFRTRSVRSSDIRHERTTTTTRCVGIASPWLASVHARCEGVAVSLVAWVYQSVVFKSDAVIVREKPNLPPRAFPGRAETPTARGWVPERSAISGRMRPRGRFTPPGDSRPPPSLRVALAGDPREPGALGPRRWGGAPQHTVLAGKAERRSREWEGKSQARAHAPEGGESVA